jgi:hypothetical protein
MSPTSPVIEPKLAPRPDTEAELRVGAQSIEHHRARAESTATMDGWMYGWGGGGSSVLLLHLTTTVGEGPLHLLAASADVHERRGGGWGRGVRGASATAAGPLHPHAAGRPVPPRALVPPPR